MEQQIFVFSPGRALQDPLALASLVLVLGVGVGLAIFLLQVHDHQKVSYNFRFQIADQNLHQSNRQPDRQSAVGREGCVEQSSIPRSSLESHPRI